MLFVINNNIKAQDAQYDISQLGLFDTDNATGRLTINCDNKLQTISVNLKEAHKKRFHYGYRVQIFFSSGSDARNMAETTKQKFLQKYSDINAYLEFAQPYFKVLVGDFRTKLEASGLKKKLSAFYPGLFMNSYKIKIDKKKKK